MISFFNTIFIFFSVISRVIFLPKSIGGISLDTVNIQKLADTLLGVFRGLVPHRKPSCRQPLREAFKIRCDAVRIFLIAPKQAHGLKDPFVANARP